MTIDPLVPLLVSALGGAAVGLERQWSGHAEGATAHFGGLRTFTLLGIVGGTAGWLWATGATLLALLFLGSAAGLVVVGYAAVSRRDVDATTEAAALVVLAAGVLAGTGRFAVSSAVIALTTLLLVEKPRLHALVRLLDDTGFRAGVRFAVMALVVLPLLPEGPFGPLGGFRPRALWVLVLFFSGLSFAGYIARTLVSDRHGYAVAGLLGGLVSSTSVTLTFSRLSRERVEAGPELAQGVLAACTVLFARVGVAVAVLSPVLVLPLGSLLVLPAAAGIAVTLVVGRRRREAGAAIAGPENPLQLGAAMQMAAAFQGVLFLLHVAQAQFGDAGLTWSAALLGLTDVDALTASFASRASAGMAAEPAALGIAVGILANTLMKLALAVAVGRGGYRAWVGVGLTAMAAASAAAIWWGGVGIDSSS